MPPAALAIAPHPKLQAAPIPSSSRSIASQSRTEERPVLRTTKEWTIPPRPKPGRKPAAEPNTAGKKAHNRASQRAFRERKQEHISELEEKVRQLEQGEGDKAVFYQNMALKAKEESAVLRRENDALRALVRDLRREVAVYRDSPPTSIDDDDYSPASGTGPTTRRAKRDGGPPVKRQRRSDDNTSVYSPPSDYSPKEESVSPAPSIVAPIVDRGESPGEPACGLCSQDGSCFCSDVGFRIDPASKTATTTSHCQSTSSSSNIVTADFETWQPAVPLKFGRAKSSTKAPIWKLETATVAKPLLCSGDPADCPACQNDPFGKAFCDALSKSVCSSNPCASCPNAPHPSTSAVVTTEPVVPTIQVMDASEESLFEDMVTLPCCGDPAACGSKSCTAEEVQRAELMDPEPVVLPRSVQPGVRTVETVPCNEAWTQLKSHPNIAFANLQLLADVVAKRTHCDGPTPKDRSPSPAPPSSPFATPTLVPHQTLLCASDAGKRKRLTVERFAVNEALNILDRAVGRGEPFQPQHKK